jgi:cytochrome oxidase Cu insertion factor (SCO1/SenC/PrrC family)
VKRINLAPRILPVILLSLISCNPASKLPSYGVVDDFELIDQNGNAFHSKTLADRVWIADFIFTNCAGPCPRMTGEMRKAQNELAGVKDARLVSFTVDPDRDQPVVLAEYAKRYHAEPDRWIFLTGPKAALHHITRDVFKLGDVNGAFDHSTRFALVDKKGRIRGFYVSSESEQMVKLIADAKALAAD